MSDVHLLFWLHVWPFAGLIALAEPCWRLISGYRELNYCVHHMDSGGLCDKHKIIMFCYVILHYIVSCYIWYQDLGCRTISGKSYQSGRPPKVAALFSATNISSNIVWLLQLHDTIQTKSHFCTKFSSTYLANEKNVWFFDNHLLAYSVRKMALICLMQNIDMCLLYKSHQIACLESHLINPFSKWIFTE